MAITFVNSATATQSTVTSPVTDSITLSDSLTNGLLLVFVVTIENNTAPAPTVSGITWDGTSMTEAAAVTNAGSLSQIVEIYYLAAPSDGGTYNLVTTYADEGANVQIHRVILAWFSGAAQSSILNDNNTQTGTTVPSMALTGGDLHVGGYHSEANDVLTPSGSFTVIQEVDIGPRVMGTSYLISSGSSTVAWTGADDTFAAAAASFNEAAGGGISIPGVIHHLRQQGVA